MILTNKTDIPLPVAVWLAYDDYDYISDPNTISATTLLKPLKEIILSRRNTQQNTVTDISSLLDARMGQAWHSSIESVWFNPKLLTNALKSLGYNQKVIDNIKVNPTKDQLTPDTIPVYLEQRSSKEINGFNFVGKFDFILNGQLVDFKNTKVFSYTKQGNADYYIKQASIYKWLNPDLITDDIFNIIYHFKDWAAFNVKSNPKYPKQALLAQKFTLNPLTVTEQFIINKTNLIKQYKDAPEHEIPQCTDDELWIDPFTWKYYKNPNKTARSTNNFTTEHEANNKFFSDGSVGLIKKTGGKVKRCKYCSAQPFCNQSQDYINNGRLKL